MTQETSRFYSDEDDLIITIQGDDDGKDDETKGTQKNANAKNDEIES